MDKQRSYNENINNPKDENTEVLQTSEKMNESSKDLTIKSERTMVFEEVVSDKKDRKKTLLITLVCVLVVLAGIYIYLAYHFDNVFFSGTTINGIDCGGLSVNEVEAKIEGMVEDYSLEIVFRDGSIGVISADDISYEYCPSGEVQQILDKQENWKWIFYVFSDRTYEVAEDIQFDEELLQTVFYDIDSLSMENRVDPVDAYITYDKYSFVIVPENDGNCIRQIVLLEEVKSAISNSRTKLNVEELGLYREPEVRSDNSQLVKECEQLNEIAAVSITYVLPGGEKVLDGNVVREWLSVDENGQYSITEDGLKEKVTEFVKNMSDEVNTVGIDRPFKATMQGDIVITGGSYGYRINQKSERERIIEDIANHSVTIREPAYTSKEVVTENKDEQSGLGNTYIEIDLTNQHLWYYVDGKLYVESDLVSGTYHNAGRRTPGGVYLLTYKARNRVLRGQKQPDGTYEYEAAVSFWMPFNGGIGLHDATWRGSFGGNIYKYSGSHGCINLPYKNAQKIYEKIDEVTPIICYY